MLSRLGTGGIKMTASGTNVNSYASKSKGSGDVVYTCSLNNTCDFNLDQLQPHCRIVHATSNLRINNSPEIANIELTICGKVRLP